MTTQGLIHSGEAFSVSRNVLEMCVQQNIIKIQRMMIKNFIINCKKIVANEIIVADREYRIKVI